MPNVADFIETKGFKLHRYAHNGASSQALAFNLLAPLVVEKDFEPLENVLRQNGFNINTRISSLEFEYEDPSILNEVGMGHPSSIDVVLFQERQPRIFIEVKLTESELGTCSQVPKRCNADNPANDFSMCYLHESAKRTYWQKMQKHGLLQGDVLKNTRCALADNYQFFRNILFALEHDGVFVLLCDERNPKFYGADNVFDNAVALLPEHYHDCVARITIQELLAQIDATGRHNWTGEFKRKYGLI